MGGNKVYVSVAVRKAAMPTIKPYYFNELKCDIAF